MRTPNTSRKSQANTARTTTSGTGENPSVERGITESRTMELVTKAVMYLLLAALVLATIYYVMAD